MPGCINIYVHASDDYKIKRAIKQYGLSPETASKEVARINKSRASHYQHYTERRWDDLNNYDLTCDTSTISHDTLVELVVELYNSRKAAVQA
jgi:cytidylate kinase